MLIKQMDDDIKARASRTWNSSAAGAAHAPGLNPGSKEFFDTVVERRSSYELPWLQQLIPFSATAGQSVLELGCGAGYDALFFCRSGADYTGVDIAPLNPIRTRQHLDFFGYCPKLLQADVESLPFTSSVFSVIYSFGVLHHTDMRKSLGEAARVLKPGGKLWLVVYHRNSIFYWLKLFLTDHIYNRGYLKQSFEQRLSRIEFNVTGELPLVQVYSRREIRRLIRNAGFHVRCVKTRKLLKEDLPSLPILDNLWRFLPQPWLDLVARRFGWYLIIQATRPELG